MASGGLAFFTGLTVDQAGSGYTIQVTTSDNSLPPVSTTAFNVTAAAASQLVITQQPPASVTAGVPFGLSVVVEDPLREHGDNLRRLGHDRSVEQPGRLACSTEHSPAPASGGVAAFSASLWTPRLPVTRSRPEAAA